jgi:hypothetical protein
VEVAVKESTNPDKLDEDPKLFIREVENLYKMCHPNIVKVPPPHHTRMLKQPV